MTASRPGRGPRLALLLTLCLALGLAAAPAEAQRRVEVYKAKHRPAAELQPLAAAALGAAGSAVVDTGTNSLVIIGEAPAVGEALALLDLQDRALRTVVLQYESRTQASLRELGIQVAWSARAGSVRIGNVILPGGRSGAFIRPTAIDAKGSRNFGGTLRILEGQSGRISTGNTVPVAVGNRFNPSTAFVTGESGFEATPRILGDGRVEVSFQPFEGAVSGGGAVRFTEAATTVMAKPGETVAVGGLTRASEGRTLDATGGASTGESSQEQVLLLTVEVE